MFYIRILIVVLIIVLFIYIPGFVKKMKSVFYEIKCNKCGSTDTILKNNDVTEKMVVRAQTINVKQKNPPSFYCNNCKKEYSMKNGTWIKRKKK